MSNTTITVTNDPTVKITGDTPTVVAIAPVTVQPTYNYNNLTNLPTLGSAAALDVGTTANHILELDSNAKIPAVDGSQLTMLPARNLNCGRLVYVSATQISFIPFKGALIQINGQLYMIPAAGISVGNTGLSANTLYYVYATISGGSLILTLSTTNHGSSPSTGNYGIEIISGNDNYSLVGMIRTNASSQFVDSVAQRFVASWFNQRPRALNNGVGSYSTSSSTWVEMGGTAERLEFLCWATTNTSVRFVQTIDVPDNGISATGAYLMTGIDGLTVGNAVIAYTGTIGNFYIPVSGTWESELTEGYHYFSIFWYSGSSGYTMSSVGNYGLMTASVFI